MTSHAPDVSDFVSCKSKPSSCLISLLASPAELSHAIWIQLGSFECHAVALMGGNRIPRNSWRGNLHSPSNTSNSVYRLFLKELYQSAEDLTSVLVETRDSRLFSELLQPNGICFIVAFSQLVDAPAFSFPLPTSAARLVLDPRLSSSNRWFCSMYSTTGAGMRY